MNGLLGILFNGLGILLIVLEVILAGALFIWISSDDDDYSDDPRV